MLTCLALLVAPIYATQWECGERSNLPIEGKNYCAAGDFRLAERNMKKVLDVLLEEHTLKFGNSEALMQTQQAFETNRDLQCAADNKHNESEPFYPMVVSQCKTRHTNLRIDELKEEMQ